MPIDAFTKAKRSEIMSRVRGRGNKTTEIALVKLFRQHSITGWRRNQDVFGKPDFLFREKRLAVFVDGCFWHGCPRCYRRPRSRRQYWDAKVVRNRRRDRLVSAVLRREGWHVMRIWEHSLAAPSSTAKRIISMLRTQSKRCDTSAVNN